MLVSAIWLLALWSGVAQAGGAADAAQRASALRAEGKFVEAREVAEEALGASPGDTALQNEEALASEHIALDAIAQHHPDEALGDLLRAQKLAPEHAKLLFDLGVLEDDMKLFRDADETLAHAERLQPADPQTLYAVARVKLDLGQLSTAEEKMKTYLALRPDDASAHYGLGRVYRQGLQFAKAQAEFELCIKLQPKQTEGYYQLGDAELQVGDYAGALANFDRTLQRQPRHGGALTGSGIVCFKQKQFERALEFLQRAVAAAADYQQAHYYLGLTLARMGREAESKSELEIAARLADEDNKHASNRLQLNESTR